MLIQGQVGPISITSSIAAGVQAPIRQGNMGEQVVSELHGRYAEATYRRAMFVVCNQTGVTHSAALTTTFVGICVGNPASSTVNLHMLGFSWTNEVALAAASSVGIMTGVGTITAALTPRNRYVGGAAGQGQRAEQPSPEPLFLNRYSQLSVQRRLSQHGCPFQVHSLILADL
jgi:hypothetical protein